MNKNVIFTKEDLTKLIETMALYDGTESPVEQAYNHDGLFKVSIAPGIIESEYESEMDMITHLIEIIANLSNWHDSIIDAINKVADNKTKEVIKGILEEVTA